MSCPFTKRRHLWVFLALFSIPLALRAQDAHSLGIGGTATASPLGIFGIYWNPSLLAVPDGSKSGWSLASGFSAFDTSNSGLPIVHFDPDQARQSSQDPIQRSQESLGLFTVKYFGAAGGLVYDQTLNYLASQGSLQFFHDRGSNSLSASPYALNYLQTNQQVADLVLSYAMPIPLGSLPFFAVGGSLKYHDGLWYEQSNLAGTYTQGLTGGYTYTKISSTSGLGLSVDLGLLAKVSDSLQVGLMLQNLQSNFTWQAVQQSYQLDPATGAETVVPGSAAATQISTPYPYATKLGAALNPPEKNIVLEGEVTWSQQQTFWRFGLERSYPEAHLVVRFGTFSDQVSDQQMWCFGVGYTGNIFAIDAAFLTRSIPDLENSISLGGALDALVIF